MQKIDQTIDSLLTDMKPIRSVKPGQSFCLWGCVTLLATLLLVLFSSLRPDLGFQMQSKLFLCEISSLAALIITLAFDAVWLSFPDLRQRAWVLGAPLLPLLVFIGCMIYRASLPEGQPIAEPAHGMDCVLCITLYSLVPGFWLFRTLRRHATIYPRLAGALALLAAASIGLLVLKFVEPNDSVAHLIKWHLIPVGILGMLGAVIGNRFLRW